MKPYAWPCSPPVVDDVRMRVTVGVGPQAALIQLG
jgi:hypothetical protein